VKIHFDFVHPSDVNLFKNTILFLKNEGHEIFLTLRNRGHLLVIAQEEFKNFEITIIGTHQKKFFKKLIALISREYYFFNYLKKNEIQLSVNQGFSNILSCKLLKIPFIIFEDDYEYKMAFYYAKTFATRDVMPDFIPARGKNTFKYHGFKELAYLHPKIFKPNIEALTNYDLIPESYVFIREISNSSLNYSERISFLDDIVKFLKNKKTKILLSLEDKSLKKQYEKNCIIINEPVQDIYSLIYFACFTISSGDTMAREACLLSNPCIYTGGRIMLMNNPLIEQNIMFFEKTSKDSIDRISYLLKDEKYKGIKESARKQINNEWDNTTDIIIQNINDFIT